MTNYNFDAVIFDLDGVITKTALVHSSAWKLMFDTFLIDYSEKHNLPFKEFTHYDDYLPYVDGKPRYKGVADFLASRNIELPFGDVEDGPEMETVCGLGNRKNQAFNDTLAQQGVQVYDSTVALMHELKEKGFRVGVASSSKNCENVLKAAGLLDLIETRVDGVVSAELGLSGKPEPDIFTTAADNLGVTYDRTVIVEDAVSGVQAGAKGNFGLTLGLAREENEKELWVNGADIVVTDISEIGFEGINKWFEDGLQDELWSVSYKDYDLKKEKSREALLTIGNGYFGTRGAHEEIDACDTNYPGTYIAGLYNRLITPVAGKDLANEDFVNAPNWISVKFKIGDGEFINLNELEIVKMDRRIDFRKGEYCKEMIVKDKEGRETLVRSLRTASMLNPHLGALSYSVTPINYSDSITLKSGINGEIINDGVIRYRQLNQQHLKADAVNEDNSKVVVSVRTTQSDIQITEASETRVYLDGHEGLASFENVTSEAAVYQHITTPLEQGQEFKLEKIVSIHTSHDGDGNPEDAAIEDLFKYKTYEQLLQDSITEWAQIWDKIDIQITGDRMSQKLVRLHLYHLMVSASPHNKDIDASITARGLHGEAYRGHIFWDELYILPLYNFHYPETAKSMLMYRYRRLEKARAYAKEYGYEGSMFPWQSGSDGREETQIMHLNPLSGKWGPDFSSLQRHVSIAVAYNTWQYFHATQDIEFLENYGAEMFFEICRFWASKAYLGDNQRYSIKNVMGPDEFHEKYGDDEKGGLKDNSYTNIMVVWCMDRAIDIMGQLSEEAKESLISKIGLSETELSKWKDMTMQMNLVISEEGILAQFDGYFNLKELDWDAYREKYGNIYRMDRILKSEGKSADDYKVAKQADTLMTFYNLPEGVVNGILDDLGYKLKEGYLTDNLNYYLARTSHGSTLSRVVHARLASIIKDKKLSWDLYSQALASDFNDIQGGTTGEGIHSGVMAGTMMIIYNTFAGIEYQGERLTVNPALADNWRKLEFELDFKGVKFGFEIDHTHILVEADKDAEIELVGEICSIQAGEVYEKQY